MKKIVFILLLVLFTPFYASAANPTTEAECHSAGGTCKHGCAATEQLFEDEIGMCGGNPWNINCCKEKTDARPDTSGSAAANPDPEAMCTCTFSLTTPPLVPFPTKICDAILASEQCTCGSSSAICKPQALTTQADCKDTAAEMSKLTAALGSAPGVVAASKGCVWSGATTPTKTAVKAKACVPKAVAKAGLGQLDMSGVSSCCISNGDCTLDDIVTTGASFANLLTQLSAAFFFATFVYGGAMYLLSFGDKGRVDKGKKAITGAAVGMLIVLMAWTIVNYIANALKAKV